MNDLFNKYAPPVFVVILICAFILTFSLLINKSINNKEMYGNNYPMQNKLSVHHQLRYDAFQDVCDCPEVEPKTWYYLSDIERASLIGRNQE